MPNRVSFVIRGFGLVYVVGFFHPVDDTTPSFIFLMLSAIWYVQLKNMKNTHRGMLLFTKSNTPQWVFFTFF